MRRATTTLMLVSLCLCLLAASAMAKKASRTPTSSVTFDIAVFPAERLWVNGGIQHGRGQIIESTVLGEGGGSQVVSLDWNIDLVTGNGTFNGTYVRDWTVNGTFGTFEGHFRATINDFSFDGTHSGQGSGGFAGMKFNGQFTGFWGSATVTGVQVILDPTGEF